MELNEEKTYPELITMSHASKLLSCHPNTLRHWDKDGTLKSVRIGKKARRYRKDDILKILGVNNKNKNNDGEKNNSKKTLSRLKIQKEVLKQSEERLKRTQRIANLGSWELDLIKNKLTWSDEVYRIFGLKPRQFGATYEAFLTYIYPEDRNLVDQAYSNSVKNGKNSYDIEHRVVRPNGEIRAVHEKCYHIKDKSGKIIRSIGMVHDITEHKETQEKIAHLASFPELNINPIIEVSRDFKVLYTNPAMLKLFPEIKKEGINHPLLRTLIEFQKKERKLLSSRVNIGEKWFHQTITHVAETNTIRAYHVDITKHKKAEDQLKAQKKELQAIFDSAPALIFYKDRENRILKANKAFASVMEMRKENLEGKSAFDIYPKEQAEKFWDDDLAVLKSGKPKTGIIEPMQTKKGTLWMQTDKIPYKDERGKIIGILGFAIDVTERTKIEQLKDEFLNIASHELKTPLTSIKTYAQILKKKLKKDKANKYFADQINYQTNKIVNLISDLLDIGKISAGKLSVNKKMFDLDKEINKIIKDLSYTTAHKIIKKGNINEKIKGDKDRLSQVLINLITNAIKYSPKANKIIVGIKKNNKKNVIVSVKDFGIGIGKENIPHIFERYFRAKKDKGGFGLGLYISSEIIKQHSGKIWVQSWKGKGSTFYFTIPRPPGR